jgi:hypothetical protein
LLKLKVGFLFDFLVSFFSYFLGLFRRVSFSGFCFRILR